MSRFSVADVLGLSVSERIQLAEDIWDSIATTQERPPLSDAQRAELDRRLKAHSRDPNAGSTWEEVKERILKGT